MKFAKKLVKDRRAKELTQAELGVLVKITRMQISKFELGVVNPEPREVRKIAKVLDADPAEYELLIVKDFARKRGLKKVSVSIPAE